MCVTGSRDDIGVKIMLGLTQDTLRDQPRPLCPIPLRLIDGEWEDWSLPKSHGLFPKFKELETEFLARIYADQKALLDQLHEKEGTDVFVATFSAVQKEATEEVLSYCVWSNGAETLLPKTDLIVLNAGENDVHTCEWDRVTAVVGDMMKDTDDYYPTRFRVRDFPTSEQIGEIGEVDG